MKYVGFIQRFEAELSSLLDSGHEPAQVVKWASDRVFESYRNGVEVGKNGRAAAEKPSRPFNRARRAE